MKIVGRQRTDRIAEILTGITAHFADHNRITFDSVIDDDPDVRLHACLTDVDVLLHYDHGDAFRHIGGQDMGQVRGANGRGIPAPIFLSGACWAGLPHFMDVIRSSLDSTTAFLGCTARVENDHGKQLFPHLLAELAELAGGECSPEQLIDALRRGIRAAAADRPHMRSLADPHRWRSELLHPLRG